MRFLCVLFLAVFTFFSTATVQAATHKNWTFLIFLNGDNSLDDFGMENIMAMEKIGSDDQVNIVVQWASLSARKSLRLLIEKSTNPNKVTSPVLQDMGYVDMGDYRNLEEFIKWGVENYPADHYFVDVWNHGGGWHQLKKKPLMGDISVDEISGNIITTEQLGEAMTYAADLIGHKVDVYGSDACLMGMAEVANEMKDSVAYYVGSQELEPGAGWPYSEILQRWEATPNATGDEVAKILVDEYLKAYQSGVNGRGQVTMSAYDMSQLSAFNHAVAAVGSDIRHLTPTEKTQVVKLSTSTLRFGYSDYADLSHFVSKLQDNASHLNLNQQNLADLQDSISRLVIANGVTTNYRNAKGISVWLPTSSYTYREYRNRYLGLRFNRESDWGAAISYLM